MVILGEDLVQVVVEGERRPLLRRVAQAVDEVSTPEGSDTLLGGHSAERLTNAGVALDLAADDVRVGVCAHG